VFAGKIYANRPLQIAGVAMTAAGLLFAIWARFHLGRNWSAIVTLKEDHELVRSGPYRWIRHPIYTGYLTAVLGIAIVAETGDGFIGFAIILVALVFKMRREERLLTAEFGEQYRQFHRETVALVPFVY
jgi:protein-S-isoprenylcysteine O-methyltransferase Ste14